MIRFFCILIFISLFSCNHYDYTLDFRKQEFPVVTNYNQRITDSLIKEDDAFMKIYESTGLFNTTDKKKYKMGEEVILTLENKTTDEAVYIFPIGNEIQRTLVHSDKKEIKNILVAEDPAIIGYSGSSFPKTNYFYLYISGIDTKTAELLGMNGFNDVLEPGEKITFRVYLPEHKGFYRFMFKRYEEQRVWGINSIWYSNAFEIE